MKLANNSWILFFVCVFVLIVYKSYDDLNFVKISINQASAVSSKELQKKGVEKREKIKVDVLEKINSKNIHSFSISSALKLDIRFEKSLNSEFIVRLEGAGEEYKNSGAKLEDWFRYELKGGELHLYDYEKNNNSFKSFSALKKMAQSIGDEVQRHDGLVMTLQFPEGYEFRELSAELVASSVKMNNVVFKKMTMKTVSGDLEVKDSEGEIIEIATVSGSNHLEINKIKKANFETVSGKTVLISSESEPQISFESVSGDFKLKMPKDANIDINFESMSGVLKSEFGLSKKASTHLEFSSLSGNAEVIKSTH